jgi:hypothetical protein
MAVTGEWHALSVRQPYAHLILAGAKQYEARTWKPAVLGEVLIHASQSFATGWKDDPGVQQALAKLGMRSSDVLNLPRGAVIGMVEITSVIECDDYKRHDKVSELDRLLCADDGDTDGLFLWRLSNPTVYEKHAACKGQLFLWPVPQQVLKKLA